MNATTKVRNSHPLFRGIGGEPEAERKVRSILSASLKRSLKTREEVAREMSAELGCDVIPSMLKEFTRSPRPKRYVRFPAAWVAAFCKATGDDELQRFLLSPELTAALELGEWGMKHLKRDGPLMAQ